MEYFNFMCIFIAICLWIYAAVTYRASKPQFRVKQTRNNYFFVEKKNFIGQWKKIGGSGIYKTQRFHQEISDSDFAHILLENQKIKLRDEKNYPVIYY